MKGRRAKSVRRRRRTVPGSLRRVLFDPLGGRLSGENRRVFDAPVAVYGVGFWAAPLSRYLQLYGEKKQVVSVHRREESKARQESRNRLSTISSHDSSASDRRSIGPNDLAEMRSFVQVMKRNGWHVETVCGNSAESSSRGDLCSVRNFYFAKRYRVEWEVGDRLPLQRYAHYWCDREQ